MTRFIKNRASTKNLPPGTLIKRPDSGSKVIVELIDYTQDALDIRTVESIEDCMPSAENPDLVTWVNIRGLSDTQLIKEIGAKFGIHSLWLEDVLNTDHRPKLEELDDLVFCIVKAVDYNDEKKKIEFEQLSLFLGAHFVISFQEHPEDVFLPVVSRVKKMKGRIRQSTADYLFYALIDSVVDEYFSCLEQLGSEVEKLEAVISSNFENTIYQDISRLRNELIYLKKSAGPIKDVLHQCVMAEREEIQDKTKKYFKDAHDHTVQVVDTINSYFQMLDSARDSFNSMQANRMNEVMKVLTTFASIFIPLTFVAGVYGMNFEHIPELKWEHGYAYFWGLMASMSLALGVFFKYKKWI